MIRLTLTIILLTVSINLKAQSDGICGADNRTRTNHNAVGRIVVYDISDVNQTNPVSVATGFIIKNGYLVTAAHLFYDFPASSYNYIIEFNVPSSSSTIFGLQGIIKSAPERRYEIIKSSITNIGQGVGQDIALFKVYPNEVTGLYPIDPNAQGAYLELNTSVPAPEGLYRVYGYGRDDRSRENSYTLQVATDSGKGYNPPPLVNGISDSPFLEFKTDILNGCSGGPIILIRSGHSLHNKVIGVVYGMQSECKNQGTQTINQSFAFYATQPNDYAKVRVEYVWNGGLGGTIGRWWKNQFFNFSKYKEFALLVGSTQVFKAYDTIKNNRCYHKWNLDNDVANHKYFFVEDNNDKLFRAETNELSTNCFIRTTAIEGNLSFGGLFYKDPWVIKETTAYLDGAKGYRNLGLSAIWEVIPENFNPNYTSQNNLYKLYKGVFLNQEIAPNKPYYSVKAEVNEQQIHLNQTGRTHKFYFQGWSANPQGSAEFHDASALQTPVVFRQQNATVQGNLYF